jgi:hypothetical protein
MIIKEKPLSLRKLTKKVMATEDASLISRRCELTLTLM